MSDDHEFIRDCLALQHKGVPLLPGEHDRLLQLLDAGFVGMDGFKYCWPEVAKENRRKMLSDNLRHAGNFFRSRQSA